MHEIQVNKEKCRTNHWCVGINSCPQKAISQSDKSVYPVVNPFKCIKCSICIDLCPFGAIERKKVN
ncbi:MAG: 4Fe-4S ferredoxin [Bacteroidia bacterium]|nr:4Fe-4S ferredoxin [Bacteroidia bacterium]